LERGSDDWCEVQYHRAHAASLSGRSAELNEIITDICSAAPDNHWTKRAVQLLGNVQARDNKDSVALPHYDVVISFAGEDRQIANEIAQKLRKEGTLVFYDDFERATLWGQDLYQYLSDIYKNRGKFCILLVSRHYARKRWTKVECRAAQARAFLQDEPYLLPVRIDETELPGLLPTVGYLSLDGDGVDGIVTAVRMKLTSY